ncbi:MAG: hypothetical protein LBU20_00095 [Candidatus Nomurabacteria bacterium]|jgi:hypothetical protein|nr:hypothetical protein [Candidatus Nomurabacteria bacterium]
MNILQQIGNIASEVLRACKQYLNLFFNNTFANEIGDNTTFYYGTKIDREQVAGDYKIGIIYSVVANP